MVRRTLATGLVILLAGLLFVACGSSERSGELRAAGADRVGGEGTGHPGEPAATLTTVPSPLLDTATLEERNRQLNDIIEFDRDVQVALAVYLNRNIAPKDRAFLCAVLHTKPAKAYFKCEGEK